MPGTTANWAIPYGLLTDPPNGAAQTQAAAERIDTLFSGADGRLTILETRTDLNGGEVRASAAQSLPSGAGTKLTFGTVVRTPTGITWNGTDTWTLLEDGVYSVYAQARKNANTGANGDAMSVSGTSYSDGTLVFPGMASAVGFGDMFVSGTRWLAAGTQLCAYYYNGAAAANATLFATRPPFFSVWRVA